MKIELPKQFGTIETSVVPVISIGRDEVEARSSIGGGPEVAVVEVEDPTTSIRSRFWVSATIKHGRPVLVVTTRPTSRDTNVMSRTTGMFNIKPKD
jgi:hypothetical protein